MVSERRSLYSRAACSKWYAKNKQKRAEYNKKWRDENKVYIRDYYEKNKSKILKQNKSWRDSRFFYSRARSTVSRTKEGCVDSLTYQIFWLWHKQRGLCAMTGKRLDRSAELDHIIPVSKGGKNEPSNLQWLAPEVNQCKNDMTVDEFMAVCINVLSHAKR